MHLVVTRAYTVCVQMNTAANLQVCSSGLESHRSAARTKSALASLLGPSSFHLKSNVLADVCVVNIVTAGVLFNRCLNAVSSVSRCPVCF